MKHNTYEQVESTLKKIYPKKFLQEYQEGIETPILRFKDRIDLSISFSNSFYTSIKQYANTYRETPLHAHLKTFLNLLSIHYKSTSKPLVM